MMRRRRSYEEEEEDEEDEDDEDVEDDEDGGFHGDVDGDDDGNGDGEVLLSSWSWFMLLLFHPMIAQQACSIFSAGDEVEKIADEVRGRISVRLGRGGAMKKHRFTC